GRLGELLHHGVVDNVDRRLVDKAGVDPGFMQTDDCVERAIDGLAKAYDIPAAVFRLADQVVDAGLEAPAFIERPAVLAKDVGHGGARAEHKAQAAVVEDALHTGSNLMPIRREVETRVILTVAGLYAAVCKHRVDAEMAGVVRHIVHAAVREMSQNI